MFEDDDPQAVYKERFQRDKPFNSLPLLPPISEIETKRTLKKAISANRALAELKGIGDLIPNQAMLVRSIVLQEAKISSEIENIVTTNDKLYRALSEEGKEFDPQTKEVLGYEQALWHGYQQLKEGEFFNTRFFIELMQTIRRIDIGIRTMPGTQVVSSRTGNVIYTPPQGEKQIRDLLQNLSEYLYSADETDPLIKMAVMHYQFEAIHPFADGNGRTGRVLNILYLIHEKLLDVPILYLSHYIIEKKNEYYLGLRKVTEDGAWEDWIIFILDAIETMSTEAKQRILAIRQALNAAIELTRTLKPKIYRKELIELIFQQPYTRITAIEQSGIAKRDAATRYLKELEEIGLLQSFKSGRELLYLNKSLLNLLVK